MSWQNIGNFLERFVNLKPPRAFMQDEIAKAIKNVLGVEIKIEDIEQRGGVIYIKTTNQALKNEIFFKKEKILEILKNRLSPRAPTDLRF